jgi:hypothetical protein
MNDINYSSNSEEEKVEIIITVRVKSLTPLFCFESCIKTIQH